MSVYSGRSICVCVCVYVKHTSTFLEGSNTAPLAFQQLAREGALKIAAVIHTEKTARTEKFEDSANNKKNKYKLQTEERGETFRKCSEVQRETPIRETSLLLHHHAFTEGAGGYLLLKLCPDGGMGVNKGNILTVPLSALWI